MVDKVESGLKELFYLAEQVGIEAKLTENKAIRDIHNDLLAIVDVYHAYYNYHKKYISEDQFKIAYNIYRSKRGEVCYED